MAKYGFKYFTRRFLNIPRWMGADSLRSTAGYIRRLSQGLTEQKGENSFGCAGYELRFFIPE